MVCHFAGFYPRPRDPGGVELRAFFRGKQAVVFVFSLPAVLLGLVLCLTTFRWQRQSDR
jgi:hypothetical protein